MFFEVENLYNDPKHKYPIIKIKSDKIICFLNLTSQYKKNKLLIKIKIVTPKFRTDKNENVFGGKNGNVNDRSSNTATKTFMK